MKQTNKKGQKNKIGAIGEQMAADYLRKKGFEILEENYLKKWGEIDLVARENGKNHTTIRFIEVKTVSYETKQGLRAAISHGTWRPEENVHYRKIQRLNRAIESWLAENEYSGEWEIDIIAVRVVTREKYATIKYLPGIIA
jgi:putative endonuclease